jgi:hypothetical protein
MVSSLLKTVFFISTQKDKKVTNKVAPGEKNLKNAKTSCQIVLFSSKKAISNHFVTSLKLRREHMKTN